jgi:hypothetical protein
MSKNALTDGIEAYATHLTTIADVFNRHAETCGLPVTMDPRRAINAIREGINVGRVSSFWGRQDESGIVHPEQMQTAVEAIVELLRDEKHQGHIVGAMQSGKTTTALALQWAGPVIYRLTGKRASPFFIIGNQKNHEDQTKIELERFLAYYGHIEIHGKKVRKDEEAIFTHSPNLVTYRECVLRNEKAVFEVPSLEDLVYRRVGGDRASGRIVEFCRRATEQGFRPLMLLDEPQFGASDRYVGDGRRMCVMAQIFKKIEDALGSAPLDHWFVGLSATPFELNDISGVWEVRQRLTPKYSGFNFFNSAPISDDVKITPPTTWSLSGFADEIGIPFLADVSLAAYDKEKAFSRLELHTDFDGDHDDYREAMEDALRETIYAVIKKHKKDGAIGLCIRAINNNSKMQALMQRIGLDPKRIEVLDYYGEMGGMSVKRAIANRKHPKLPYLVIVTNRARMADAFPTNVRFFMDLAKQSTDLNALLQGLLGRACGYNKQSTVVLSDANADIVDAYVATQGGYVHKTSRHSVPVNGGYRRGAPTMMVKVRTEMDDPIVKAFFARINKDVVEPNIEAGAKMKVPRKRGGEARLAPVVRIAEELKLFDHIEKPKVRAQLFPNFVTGFQVVRRGDRVRGRDRSVTLSYEIDDAGDCRFTFRSSDRTKAAKGGGAGRAKGKKDIGQWLEPTVYVEKYNAKTDEIITDENVPGSWRAFMVTFPLREAVREVIVSTVAYPVPESPFDAYLKPEEREHRDTGRHRRAPMAAS